MDRDVAPALYFYIGLRYIDVLGALAINHRIVISMSTLKRSLSQQNLFRRRHYTIKVSHLENSSRKVMIHGYQQVYSWYNWATAIGN